MFYSLTATLGKKGLTSPEKKGRNISQVIPSLTISALGTNNKRR